MAQSGASLAKSAMHERREWPRYQAEKSFALVASIDGRVLACTVADVSLGGAKLIFDAAVPAVDTIELTHSEAEPVLCKEVWRGGQEIGVEFDFSENSLDLISVCIRNMIDLTHEPPVTA